MRNSMRDLPTGVINSATPAAPVRTAPRQAETGGSTDWTLTRARRVPATQPRRTRRRRTNHDRLRAVVLLAGSVRQDQLADALGRCRLDLPLEGDVSILGQWQQHMSRLMAVAGGRRLPLRVLLDHDSPMPHPLADGDAVTVQAEEEPRPYRGTGGVLGDIAADYDDDDLILVGAGAQVLLRPVQQIVAEMLGRQAEVVIAAPAGVGTVGLMLLRVGVLRGISPIGYVDFKEQALPQIAEKHSVAVLHCVRSWSLPVRTMADYIVALRALCQPPGLRAGALDEDWRSSFSVVEPGGEADRSARLHDAVVLAGGRVEPGAVVVRSVVGPGGVVRRNQTVADCLVAGGTPARTGGRS